MSVAYSLNCKDTGADCGFAVTAETEDEVMQHVATHAAEAHPDLELTPETVANVKSLIQKS
jgi:predicted small metal-binding protein